MEGQSYLCWREWFPFGRILVAAEYDTNNKNVKVFPVQ